MKKDRKIVIVGTGVLTVTSAAIIESLKKEGYEVEFRDEAPVVYDITSRELPPLEDIITEINTYDSYSEQKRGKHRTHKKQWRR